MKVENKNIRIQLKNRDALKKTGKNSSGFKTELLNINRGEINNRLDELLLIIDEQGEKLKKSLDQKDLVEYRRSVREFLRFVQKEYARTKQTFSWDQRGNVKTYTIMEKVDQNLEELYKLFMEEQSDVLQIVGKLDEIRGFLLDLYI